jgi:hypothetical protein
LSSLIFTCVSQTSMLVRLHACMHACLLASRFSCRTDCVSAVRLGYVENQDMSQHALSDKAVELISTRSLDKKNKSTLTFQETCSDVPLGTLPMPICHGSLTLISVPPTFTFAYGTGYKEKHVAIVVDPVLSMATSFDAVEQYMCVSQTRRLSRQSAPYFYHWATSLHDTPKAIKQRSRSFAPL